MTCSGYHILLSYMLCHATLDKLAYYCKSNLERWYWKVLLTSNQTSLQFIFHQQHLNKCINKRFNFLKSEIFHMVQILWWPISWKYSQYYSKEFFALLNPVLMSHLSGLCFAKLKFKSKILWLHLYILEMHIR